MAEQSSDSCEPGVEKGVFAHKTCSGRQSDHRGGGVGGLLQHRAPLSGKNNLIFSSQGATLLITTQYHPQHIQRKNGWETELVKCEQAGYTGRWGALRWDSHTRTLVPMETFISDWDHNPCGWDSNPDKTTLFQLR